MARLEHQRLKDKEAKISKLIVATKEESRIFERVVNKLVSDHCAEMDDFMSELDRILQDVKRGRLKNYSQLRLEMKCLELAASMYRATDGLSELGSQSDVARVNREEKFALAYSEITEGTIPDKKTEASAKIAEEILVDKIMERAYKVIAQKVKSANRLLEAMKKVITSRMVQKEVFRKDTDDAIDMAEYVDDGGLEDDGDNDI